MRPRFAVDRTPQGAFSRGEGAREYQRLEQIILDQTGVACSVFVNLQYVSIRAASYADFVMAKAAIKGRVSVEIVQG